MEIQEEDSEEDTNLDNRNSPQEPLRRSTRTKYPPKPYWIANSQQYAEANIAYLEEPQTFEEAMSQDIAKEWEKAMKMELKSIEKNKTWTLINLPPRRKPIGYKWVYRLKYNAMGVIERYKARIVAKGYSQKEGIDYTETFAPVSKFASIRLLLAIGAQEDYEIHQMDVQTAFLNGELEEEIYMSQPEGFIKEGKEDLVCRLHKSLYGLKQAGRTWYLKLNESLVGMGFRRCNADYSIYYIQKDTTKIIILVYVDDLVLLSNNLFYLEEIKKTLGETFAMKDMGEILSYLGIGIKRDRKNRSISLNQLKYIEDILKKNGMEDVALISTPMDVNSKLTKEMCPKT